VATRLRCDAIFNHLVTQSLTTSTVKRILKMGQHLLKLWPRIKSPVFRLTGYNYRAEFRQCWKRISHN